MQLAGGDVIENLHLGTIMEGDVIEDSLVIVTVWGDRDKTVFALQMDRPYWKTVAGQWDAFVLARETVSLPEIRPNRLLED